jgi:hypothetical protein
VPPPERDGRPPLTDEEYAAQTPQQLLARLTGLPDPPDQAGQPDDEAYGTRTGPVKTEPLEFQFDYDSYLRRRQILRDWAWSQSLLPGPLCPVTGV